MAHLLFFQNTTCLIDGLTPHTPYFFRVFAENKVGLSQPCQTPDVTVTAERKPSTLTRLLSFDSDGKLTGLIATKVNTRSLIASS